ncbi:gastrula zinc finger protein XlCGF48.2-like isoform X4 [Biomphalaria glabrata]|uniref:Gastrula zinc finger protein XlCGF48.2-like isoform X4 n=1 Tax=Biomphalaria glabrata TaxID=6526 RepID=A0A9W3BGK3_BIOGL|nr:gastrula zinc finger protein XlCGF48.2-like isoform X4 [Biomphalaria glabrata]
MDFDSSSKFISSLAKFLQSLCNGYVEFNSGVEVIGHIYLNVDTGKKIDYILNEKVCKTDENSVTFISNSFHAQPAERPKPTPKGFSEPSAKSEVAEPKIDEDEIIIMDEPESKNSGTLPPSRNLFHRKNINPYSKVGRSQKRPHSQNFSSFKHLPKQRKSDPPIGPNGAQHDVEISHTDNNTSNFITPQISGETSLTAATDSDISHLSKVFPQTFNDSSNNLNACEERDIKPQLDSDMNIVQVKQEITQSEHGGEEDQETYDESQDQSNVFPGMPYDQYYSEGNRRGQRADYGPGGLSHDYFQGNAGPSGEGGDTSAFHSMSQNDVIRNDANSKTNFRTSLKRRMNFECHVCGKRLPSRREFVGHMNGRHLGQKPFSCEMCGRQFAYMTSLPVHRKTCPARRLAQSSGLFPLSAGNTTSQNPFNTLDRTSQY